MSAAAEGSPVLAANPAARRSFLRSEGARGLALVSPTFLYALLLLGLPILLVIAYSFWSQHYLTVDRTFTLDNYGSC